MTAARPLVLLRRIFSHKLEPGDTVVLDGPEEASGRIGYTLSGPDGEVKSCGVTPAEVYWGRGGSVLFWVAGDDCRTMADLLSRVDRLSMALNQRVDTTGDYVFDLDAEKKDSTERVLVSGKTLGAALEVMLGELGRRDHFAETRKRAVELAVMVDPGWYWGKPSKTSLWSCGRVLSYESISGPAGTVWCGNEVVPVGDMFRLVPAEPPGDESVEAEWRPYKPPMVSRPWPSVGRADAMTAEEWNEQCAPETPVRYWPVRNNPTAFDTRTRSEAWTLGDGTPVVKILGFTGGVALAHLKKLAHVTKKESTR